jgi:uncharacterized membrane protein YozB (DUF420 family)
VTPTAPLPVNPWTWLATLNASLNAASALCLMRGARALKRRQVATHRKAMLAATFFSCLFLASYLLYHAKVGSVPFRGTGWIRHGYLVMLLTHILLAALVPLLALRTLYLGWTDRRSQHRRLARWALPIWLYVSVTGVLIYLLVYHWPNSATPGLGP